MEAVGAIIAMHREAGVEEVGDRLLGLIGPGRAIRETAEEEEEEAVVEVGATAGRPKAQAPTGGVAGDGSRTELETVGFVFGQDFISVDMPGRRLGVVVLLHFPNNWARMLR